MPAPHAQAGDRRHQRAAGADLLQVLLPGEHHQLLHLLSDRPLPRLGAQLADAPVRVPRLGRARHACSADRWATARPQVHHLGLDPRRAALHAAAAARQSVLDRRADRPDRPHPGLGVSRPSWSTRRNCCPAVPARWRGCSSASPSAWAASAPRCWASSPTHVGINFVYQICAFLPLIGLLAGFLPDIDTTGGVRPARQ